MAVLTCVVVTAALHFDRGDIHRLAAMDSTGLSIETNSVHMGRESTLSGSPKATHAMEQNDSAYFDGTLHTAIAASARRRQRRCW